MEANIDQKLGKLDFSFESSEVKSCLSSFVIRIPFCSAGYQQIPDVCAIMKCSNHQRSDAVLRLCINFCSMLYKFLTNLNTIFLCCKMQRGEIAVVFCIDISFVIEKNFCYVSFSREDCIMHWRVSMLILCVKITPTADQFLDSILLHI